MRRGIPICAALCAIAAVGSVQATAAPKPKTAQERLAAIYPPAVVRPGAATPKLRRTIARVNNWWVTTKTSLPCDRCDVLPPGTSLIWTFYKGQGLYPNWVRASREVIRLQRRGEMAAVRRGTFEILGNVSRVRLGKRYFRVIHSAYDAPDGQPAPWADAMGAGLILTLIVPSLPENPTPRQIALARTRAEEHLRAFGVNYRKGGLASKGPGRGLWYLEYAYRRGAQVRVLNGSMQSLVSLDRFSRQATDMARRDPAWLPLAWQAQDYVIRGSIELARTLPKYDVGGGRSRYSFRFTEAAPLTYHLYHVDLLRKLEAIPYLPAQQRAVISRYRGLWGGSPPTLKERTDDDPLPPVGIEDVAP